MVSGSSPHCRQKFEGVLVAREVPVHLQGTADVPSSKTLNPQSAQKKRSRKRKSMRRTHRTVLSILVVTSALAEGHTFVSTEDETRFADAAFHAGMVTRATRPGGILTGGLATSGSTWVVLTARGTLQC